MKGLITSAVAWLSADPLARFAARNIARDTSTISPNGSDDPPPKPPIRKYYVNGTSNVVNGPSTEAATALYTMSNVDGGPNTVYAYKLLAGVIDSVTPPKAYSANGNGRAFPYTGNTVQDALDSQGSLIQVGSRLFAVNAGSDTVMQWAVNCTDPTTLIPLGGAVAVNGNFPSTIGVADQNQIFCVATTGKKAGIQCYVYQVGFGPNEIQAPQPFYGTQLDLVLPAPQTNPPLGPANTVSQLLFTDDNRYLIAIVKSAVNSAGKVTASGYINVYSLTDQGLGKPVTSKPAKTALLFGCTLQYNTYNLFCADSAVGGVFLTSNSDLTYTVTNTVATSKFGGGTPCWTTRSKFLGGPDYLSAVDKNYIAAFAANNGTLLTSTNFTATSSIAAGNPQLIEIQSAARFLYGLSFGNNQTGQHLFIAADGHTNGTLQSVFELQFKGAASTSVEGLALFIPNDPANTCDFK